MIHLSCLIPRFRASVRWRSAAGIGVAGRLLLCHIGLALTARADLEWKESRVVLRPAAGAKEAVADFEFTNRGNKAVHIINVQTGCSCTAAALERDTIEPGGVGKVRATYRSADKQGKQTVAVTVSTEEPELRTYELSLEVFLKEFATLAPQSAAWRVGEECTPKHFDVRLASGFTFVGAESTNPDFVVTVGAATPDRAEFTVMPRDLWAKRSAVIKVKVASPENRVTELMGLVRVQ